MYETIFEQLKDYCNCVEDFTLEDVMELVDIISMATGWVTKPCENFLFGERTEYVELPRCLNCVIPFEPYFHPFDPESFTFALITQDELNETKEEITEFGYSEVDKNFRVKVPLPSCQCACVKCGCEPKYKLMVTYNAGYMALDDCLLPVFCNLIEIVHARRSCDCKDCQTCTTDENSPSIKYYNGDLITVNLETELAQLLTEQYKRQLGTMSLMQRTFFWGIKV